VLLRLSAKSIALSGVMAAFVVVIVYLQSIYPTNKLSLMILASLFISIVVIEAGAYAGFIFYISTGILIFFIVPDKISFLVYVGFFGYYGILKYLIEMIDKRLLQILCKLVYFSIFIFVGYYFLGNIFFPRIDFIPIYAIEIGLLLILMGYDYLYTLFIRLYYKRFKGKI
jgi:hypothetical protein